MYYVTLTLTKDRNQLETYLHYFAHAANITNVAENIFKKTIKVQTLPQSNPTQSKVRVSQKDDVFANLQPHIIYQHKTLNLQVCEYS